MSDPRLMAAVSRLERKIAENPEEFLAYIGIEEKLFGYSRSHLKQLCCRCPVHEGDNPKAFHAWIREDALDKPPFIWRCFTNNCHQDFGATAIGLVRGVKQCSFREALKIALDFFSLSSIEELIPDKDTILKLQENQTDSIFQSKGGKNAKRKSHFRGSQD